MRILKDIGAEPSRQQGLGPLTPFVEPPLAERGGGHSDSRALKAGEARCDNWNAMEARSGPLEHPPARPAEPGGDGWAARPPADVWGPPRDEPPRGPVEPERPLWRRAGGALVALAIVLAKWGKGALLVLPKLKILTTSASMLVSVAAYALLWGWKFAVGFVALLFVHEMGHVVQLRREGIKASAPMFIPFLGAYVGMKELPRDAAAEARVGLAGPILGSIGCLVPLAIYEAGGDQFWQALAFVGFFLNLINLLPVLPLDGGRAMAALTPWMWLVGFGLLVVATIAWPNPVMILVVLLGGLETWRRWKARKSPESQRYHEVKPATRVAVAAIYIGLAVLLALAMNLTFVERSIDSV